jgi:probable HAF family extracellular repeat protein
VLWDADGTAHDLGNLGSKVINMALSINNQGQVTGVSAVNDQAVPSYGTHAFLWTSAAGIEDLGTLPGDAATVGAMINDAGDVVGPSFDPNGNPRAYLWHKGVMNDLNELVVGNSPLYLLFSTAIDSSGEITGFGATESGDVHGFLAIPTAGASASALSANRPMVLRDNVRELVRQRLALGRGGSLYRPR